jgi:hypothetical protein
VSRRRRARPLHHAPSGAARWWTIPRAAGVGIVAGIGAILLGGLFEYPSDAMLAGYLILVAVTALCGASMLWITLLDMRERGTSGRILPIRGFDVALGLALLLPSLYALRPLWRTLGL